MPNAETINLFVAYDPTGPLPWGRLLYFTDADKQHPAPNGGNLKVNVRALTTVVSWKRANGETFTFHGLTIHPRDPNGQPANPDLLDLTWVIEPDSIQLYDQGVAGKRRMFNYTLSIEVPSPRGLQWRRIYFDPEFVDIGGE